MSPEAQRALFVHIDGLEQLLARERASVQRQAAIIRTLCESDGNVLVPLEPTTAMREAGMPWVEADSAVFASEGARAAYIAMIEARPDPRAPCG